MYRISKKKRIIGYSVAIPLFLLTAAYSALCSPSPTLLQKALFIPSLCISVWVIGGLMLFSGRINKSGIQCNWLESLIPWIVVESINVIDHERVTIVYDGGKSITFFYDTAKTLELLHERLEENRS